MSNSKNKKNLKNRKNLKKFRIREKKKKKKRKKESQNRTEEQQQEVIGKEGYRRQGGITVFPDPRAGAGLLPGSLIRKVML